MIDALDEVEEGSIIMGLRLFEWDDGHEYSDSLGGNVAVLTEYYSRETDRQLIPVRLSFVLSSDYKQQRDELIRRGMVLPEREDIRRLPGWEIDYWMNHLAEQIAVCNPDRDVYYYEIADKETERCELVRVNLN